MPELHFKGKEFVYNHHLTVPFRPLVHDASRSCGEDPDNLIIHGDNLHALKSLRPRYAGQVDLVFIDPPYNTGNEGWAYNDNVASPLIKEWLDGNPVNAEDMLRHDKWLCLMWPRLKLLHELLSERGSIWITLDDNEVHHARAVLDEVFGEQNFVATCIWQKNFSPKNTAQYFSEDHDYLLVYAKNKADWRPNLLERSEDMQARYSNPDNDPRGPWTSGDLSARNFYGEGTYAITTPTGRVIPGPPPGMYWRVKESKFKDMDADRRIWWGDAGDNQPRIKRFLSEVKQGVVPQTLWFHGDVGHTQDAKKELLQVMDFANSGDVFVTPKPSSLIQRILELGTDEDAIVLDSFAGSGTTAHAVLAQNAKDGGNRKFILVECEDYADSLTAERVRRVIEGYAFTGTQREELLREKLTFSKLKKANQLLLQAALVEKQHAERFDAIKSTVKDGELVVTGEKSVAERAEGLGGGFSYCKLGAPLALDDLLSGASLPDFAAFGGYLFHTATGQPLDPARLREADGYLGESAQYHVWLIYRADLDFLKSRDAALTLALAEKIAATDRDKPHLVFAPARFVPQKKLLELGVEHAPLPYALYRIEKG
ncbi:MAG: site-specific DNA-methyltransferase [Rhodanobacteraceae bacterium]|nr:site-specific DNA-methyltransferase [Rhodanobacteraceae bacterium]